MLFKIAFMLKPLEARGRQEICFAQWKKFFFCAHSLSKKQELNNLIIITNNPTYNLAAKKMPLLDPVSVWFWIFLQEFLQKWSMINLNAENQKNFFIILSYTREALDIWACSDNRTGTKSRRKENVWRFFFVTYAHF